MNNSMADNKTIHFKQVNRFTFSYFKETATEVLQKQQGECSCFCTQGASTRSRFMAFKNKQGAISYHDILDISDPFWTGGYVAIKQIDKLYTRWFIDSFHITKRNIHLYLPLVKRAVEYYFDCRFDAHPTDLDATPSVMDSDVLAKGLSKVRDLEAFNKNLVAAVRQYTGSICDVSLNLKERCIMTLKVNRIDNCDDYWRVRTTIRDNLKSNDKAKTCLSDAETKAFFNCYSHITPRRLMEILTLLNLDIRKILPTIRGVL